MRSYWKQRAGELARCAVLGCDTDRLISFLEIIRRADEMLIYILASKPRGTLYIGVTNSLILRVEEHKAGKGSSFTRRYSVDRLVWFQEFADVREAIQREKTMKEWPRAWKINLIEREKPRWDDLHPSLPGVGPAIINGVR